MTADPLTVALIRSLNARHPIVESGESDESLIAIFGRSAQPLADAIRQTIREEIERERSVRAAEQP